MSSFDYIAAGAFVYVVIERSYKITATGYSIIKMILSGKRKYKEMQTQVHEIEHRLDGINDKFLTSSTQLVAIDNKIQENQKHMIRNQQFMLIGVGGMIIVLMVVFGVYNKN